jgi:hypothetical protein
MIGYRLTVFVLLLTIPLFGCSGITGTDTYVNKHYKDKPKSNVRLAIVPLTRLGPPLPCSSEARKCPPLIPLIDNVFEKVFGRFPNKVTIIPMAKARRFFEANQDVLNKLVDIKYSDEDLSGNPSLETIFDNKQLASLREELAAADLLLVPVRFDLIPKFGRTFGYSEFRLYDLDSGSMIFTSSRNMNVNIDDEDGRALMAGALIDRSTSDFEELYLNK